MSKRLWVIALLFYELTWLVYLALLLPVAFAILTHAPEAELRAHLLRLTPVLPFVLLITALCWSAAIYDIAHDPGVSRKVLWVLGFLLLGMVVLPIYFALIVRVRSNSSSHYESLANRR